MAMRAVLGSIKFNKFRKSLSIPPYAALGILESLWHLTSSMAIRGDIGRHSNEDIADWIGWEGNADELIGALVKTGWLDTHPIYRLSVHHWSHHAERWIKVKLGRQNLTFIEDEGNFSTNGAQCAPMSAQSATMSAQCAHSSELNAHPPSQAKPSQASPLGERENVIKFPVPDESFLPKDLDTVEFRKAWQEWETYWYNIKGTMQPFTRTGQWTELLALGPEEAIKRIRYTMNGGYRNLITRKNLDDFGREPKKKPSLGPNTEHEEKCRVARERKERLKREADERARQENQEPDRIRKAAVV